MEFTNQFHVPLPLEETWALMLDIPRILPCLPGATLKEVRGEHQYLGAVSVKLGPIKLSFDGQAELVRTDEEQHIAWLKGSGLDPKGRGAAQSEFNFALTPAAGGGTDVTVTTQLQLSGAVAQYGRGSGMIAEVAGHILKQFEENLAASLQDDEPVAPALPPAVGPVSAPGQANPPAAGAPGVPLGAGAPVSAPEVQALLLQSQAILAQAQAVLAASQQALHDARKKSPHAAPSASCPPGGRFLPWGRPGGKKPGKAAKPKELNMLSIGLKAMWSQFKGLFSRH